MNKDKPSVPTLAYRYDITPKRGMPLTPLDYIRDQLGKARGYRNKLIALELDRRNKFAEIRARNSPGLQEAEAAYQTAAEELARLDAEIKARNARERRKRATPEEQAARKVLVSTKKEKAEALKLVRQSANQTAQGEELDRMEELHSLALKSARREAVKGGLYTFAANGIAESLRDIRKGSPPEFRKWDGSGFLYCQIQTAEQGYKPLHWQDVLLCQDTRLQATRQGKYTILKIRLGSVKAKPIWVEAPIVLHRAPPVDAVIKGVKLVCKRKGREFHYSVSLSLARKAGWEKTDLAATGVVAVDIGRRTTPEGLRVAVWIGSDGQRGKLLIPSEMQSYIKKCEDLQSIRDKRFNDIKGQVLAYYAAVEAEEGEIRFHPLSNSKSKLLDVLSTWRRKPGDEEVYASLLEWRRKEIHLERWQTDQREKFERWRKDHYRNFWAMLRKRYAQVLLQDVDWAKMQLDPPPSDNEDKTALVYWRNVASDGLLDASANAREVVRLPICERRCSLCGEMTNHDKRSISFVCPHCGETLDTDFNDCALLLARG